ncbi:hypothetical protein A2348_02510 [Candidatus Uhrbacteria bacterium RIFOXYB12_FULL_58_10]|uniref:Uncharacterized protein n=1 Tax=Candidatus Uhrbacteria bacterium RIFOXYB2_FULL_57_15 TaxID=1802422 RepID=A0A1F7W6E5_9BACT|nr:MAG: hypothetical protein A2348_02510 [Candidatus Uhrbacteria bacterium RIFOXYB12_FULL_58_10]OGL98196.1 MAG: hypothetical protein A2304_03740 [Candidatus Uhrbacteria bacterium RIFOXYB2_FULL_57_15]OGL99170.1 MAG: hypothetical protein A2501_03155 [Candidatus Uhrbacteria bacterium RIFOXYC12_FULL_57_11]
MDLDLALKVIAWAMTVTPVTVFLVISFYMMSGAAEDDDSIKGLIMLGLGIFSVGAILLLMTYFAGFSTEWFLK